MQPSTDENAHIVTTAEFIRKIIHFSIPSWIGFFINIGSTIVITRYFLPDAFGLINTFNATATLIMAIVCLGLDSGFMRYFYDTPEGYDRNRLFLISILVPFLILLALSAVMLTIASAQLSIFIFGTDNFFIMSLLTVNIFELLIIRFITIYYRMEGNTFLYGMLTVSMQLALKGSLVFAAFIKPEYGFAILSSVIALVCLVTVFIVFNGKRFIPSKKTYSIAEIKLLKPYFVYSIYTWPIPILLYFNILATQIIIRSQLGNEAVGIFTSVNVFVGVIAVIQSGFATYWSGFMFENYQTQSSRIIKMHDYLSFLLIVLMVCFVLFRDLMFLLLGAKYQVSKPFFALLLLYPLLMILSETTAYGISIAKKTHLMLIITFISVMLNLTIIWFIIPQWGLIGACVGSAVLAVVFFLLQSYYAQKYYRSIEHVGRTIFTIFSLVSLAVGNLLLNDLFWGAASLSITILLTAVLVYRKEILNIINMSKRTIPEAV